MTKKPQPKSEGEELLAIHLKAHGILYLREFLFYPKRKWAFDFFFGIPWNIAVEIEGGIWTKGRHGRGAGMEADMEKYNAATIMGYRILRFSTGMVKSGKAIDTILEALG